MAISITSKTSTHNTTASKNRSILYLVIHYTAGTTSKKGSAANTASYFSTTENQASADFIVDDSTIVQYNPDPANRYCWHCGGNKYTTTKGGSLHGVAKNANSIGIEICSTNSTGTVKDANDSTWSYTDAAVAKAVELAMYLMDKYGIDADHVIRHYDVTGKLCPGIIGWNADSGDESKWLAFKAQLGAAADDGSMTDAEMYSYFKSQGLNDFGAAGLMGNLYAESALAANNLQNTGNTKLGMTDAEYTSAVDGGSYTNFVKDGYGYGLAQWTYYSRKQALLDFMNAAGVSIGHKRKQCEFIMQELSGYSSVLKTLKNATSVLEASNAVLTGYEKPADQSESVKTKRAGYGQKYYDKYAESADAGADGTISVSNLPAVPFTVKVLISDLNYRSEGSMNGTVKGQTGKGTFTIVEVNSDGWGRLKSGAGWIYLLNTTYCTIGSTVTESKSSDSSSGASVSYTVKVTISNLNIRKGPGTISYMNLIEHWGSGIPRIIGKVKAAGLREPEFIGGEVDLRINIYRGQVAPNAHNDLNNANKVPDNTDEMPDSADKVPDTIKKVPDSAGKMPDTIEGLPNNEQEQQIYKYVLENGSITTAETVELLGVKHRRARAVLMNMVEGAYLRKEGAARSTIYVKYTEGR